MYKFIFLLALLFLPVEFASATSSLDFFAVPQRDLSMSVIGEIFGVIDSTTLPSVGSHATIFGSMFGIFNLVALNVGMVIVAYSVITGTLSTAHEGTPLGEKLSSTWTPFRMAVGVALLLPRDTGYCMAQIVVMWLVLMGIGAADTLWGSVLTYLDEPGVTIFQSGPATPSPFYTDLKQTVDTIVLPAIKSMMCVNYNNQFNPNGTNLLNNSTYIAGVAANSQNQQSLMFGKSLNPTATPPSFVNPGAPECSQLVLPTEYTQVHLTALQSIYASGGAILTFVQKVNQFETNDASQTNHYVATPDDVTGLIAYAGNLTSGLESPGASYYSQQNTNTYSPWAQGFMGYWNNKPAPPERSTPPGGSSLALTTPYNYHYLNSDNTAQMLADSGWMVAGNYYRAIMSRPPGGLAPAAPNNVPAFPTGYSPPASPPWAASLTNPTLSTLQTEMDAAVTTLANAASGGGSASATGCSSFTACLQQLGSSGPQPSGLAQTQSIQFFNQIGGNFGTTGDPFNAPVTLGVSLMEAAATLITITVPTSAGLLMAFAGICAGEQPFEQGAATALYDTVFPAAMAGAAYMYGIGSILGVYLPLIPFLIFLATAVGWILSVVESMVAAPLIALGLVWPDAQNEILGRAEPSVMMILNLMLRPSLIVIGLFFGMVICGFMLKICNLGFSTLVRFGDLGMDDLVGQYVALAAYMAAVLVVVTKCFGLIHLVPDKVLSWIGDHTQHVGGGEDFLAVAKQGTEAGSGALTGGATATAGEVRKQTKATAGRWDRAKGSTGGSLTQGAQSKAAAKKGGKGGSGG